MNEPTAIGNTPEVASAPWPSIAGYEIVREIGRGGMGVVYEAKQLSTGERVALKLIRDSALASPAERTRFRIESAAAARMQHPNIVNIVDIGEQDGRPYFAMDFVQGGSLDKALSGKPQPPRHAAELLRRLAHAVQHAHEQKIIHRDLKPANVLLQVEDLDLPADVEAVNLQSANPKITDFGLAKRLDAESTAVTQEGDVLGTASYMAPEQAAGRVADIGPAVDVYALGAMLYELLVGRPPFQAATWQETVQQVLHEEPLLPSEVRADVPREVESICLRCLEKEPERRYASARDIALDLERYLKDEPVLAPLVDEKTQTLRHAERAGFEIVSEIASSPRRSLYHAVYRPLKQAVALKVFRRSMCTQGEWETRLQRATDVWATLTHPQIVPVSRAGWWAGAAYLAVEFVPQGSLGDAFAGKPCRAEQAILFAEQTVEIVSYLHRQGAVHGNLKPSNVLLGANGIPRLVDLHITAGIFWPGTFADQSDATELAFRAPELLSEVAAEPRPYTDMYGIGVILYALLTGRPPFTGRTAEETAHLVRNEDPIVPSTYNREVTPALDAFCLRCLRKNPWHRFERAYNMLGLLRGFRDELVNPPSSNRRRPPASRH